MQLSRVLLATTGRQLRRDRMIMGSARTGDELDDDRVRLHAIAEPLHAETLVAELADEAFIGAVLPRFAGVIQTRVAPF